MFEAPKFLSHFPVYLVEESNVFKAQCLYRRRSFSRLVHAVCWSTRMYHVPVGSSNDLQKATDDGFESGARNGLRNATSDDLQTGLDSRNEAAKECFLQTDNQDGVSVLSGSLFVGR